MKKKINVHVMMARLIHIAGGVFDEWLLHDTWKRSNH
jgi:hypothetical protein